MKFFPTQLSNRLESLEQEFSLRVLAMRQGIDFSSNDYLSFNQDPEFRSEVYFNKCSTPLGSTGSRLIRGQHLIFEEVELELAEFCSRESALIFPSGYQANLALLSGVLKPGDWVFSDELNHASLIDGIRLSGARKEIFRHQDLDHLRTLLIEKAGMSSFTSTSELKVIVTESVFGMEGDLTPLQAIVDLADEFSALLIVDEAHATGLWGDFGANRGGGRVQKEGLSDRVFATVHPAGKAMGVGGAWVCGDALLKDYLVNFSRPFIFSTAPSPVLVQLLQGSLHYWKKVGRERAQRVLEMSHRFWGYLQAEGIPLIEKSKTGPIFSVLIGKNEQTLQLAQLLQSKGFDIRAIRPPTVPAGKARLRITMHWGNSESELRQLADTLQLSFSREFFK